MDCFYFLGILLISTGFTFPGVLSDTASTVEDFKNAVTDTITKILATPELIPSLNRQKRSPRTVCSTKKSYDFIIVGAGSAGSVLANLLSKSPCVSVLLLEAGGKPPVLTEIPAAERFNVHTSIDWDYTTVPQNKTGSNLINQSVNYASGKVLGGSSVLNDVQYSRGNPKDYDDWEAMGAKGWGFEDIEKYFKIMEDNRDPEYVANGYHGTGGPQTIEKPGYSPDLKKALFGAAKTLEIPITDVNGANQTGFYDVQGTERTGQLCSTAKGYLVPVDFRTNLDIVSDALVTKIIMEKNVATGVEYIRNGKTRKVYARKEVICSAGTIATPKLLMLSGIGPADHLRDLNIPVNVNLPGCGQNLQEHVGTVENFLVNNTEPVALKLANPVNVGTYVQNRTGPYSAAQFVIVSTYLENENNTNGVPDHLCYFVEFSAILPLLDFNLKLEAFAAVYLKYLNSPFYACLCHLLHPRSRGTVTLKSSDPQDPPVIDPNTFDDPADVQDVVAAMKDCLRISDTPSMKAIGAERFDTLFLGCEDYANDTDEYYTCQTVSAPVTFYHYAGTAKMGDPSDKMAVVDPELRVIGAKNLRVVDASVMPKITTGNTNIPTIMIANKAADMIIAAHNSTFNCSNYDPSLKH